MPIEIVMPRLSDTMEEGKILRWLKQVGDTVQVGEVIAEVETDKADMEIEAFDEGVLAEIRVQEGESAPVGAVIAVLAEAGEAATAKAPARKPQPPPAVAPAAAAKAEKVEVAGEKAAAEATALRPQARAGPPPGRVLASPLVRRIALERKIDLANIPGSGPGGRIVKSDLEGAAAVPPLPRAPREAPPPAAEGGPAPGPARREELSRMRATIARRMAESKREIPHFYVTAEIDMSEAVRLKEALAASDRIRTRVTYTHLVLKAVAVALERHPQLNASFEDGARVIRDDINLGIAVAVEDGLIVPVLHGCGGLALLEIARRSADLVERTRGGKLRADDLSGGTFTVSNLGALPVEHFAAVINPPQGAILALGAIKERAVARDGHVATARTLMATLSCDHRIMDGTVAGQFLAELKKLLENPVSLMV